MPKNILAVADIVQEVSSLQFSQLRPPPTRPTRSAQDRACGGANCRMQSSVRWQSSSQEPGLTITSQEGNGLASPMPLPQISHADFSHTSHMLLINPEPLSVMKFLRITVHTHSTLQIVQHVHHYNALNSFFWQILSTPRKSF